MEKGLELRDDELEQYSFGDIREVCFVFVVVCLFVCLFCLWRRVWSFGEIRELFVLLLFVCL